MKHILSFTFALLLTALLPSCNNNADTSDTDAADSTATMTIAVLPTTDCLPFYVAEQCGIFDTLGLDARLVTYGSAMDADTAFCRGAADCVVTDLVKAVLWHTQGDSISVVMSGDLHMALITTSQSRLTNLKSIKEKIIAITRHSALDYNADRMLESIGMTTMDMNKPQINDIALRAQMVVQNQYDGALLPEPYATQCMALGAHSVATTDSLPSALTQFVVVTHKPWEEKHEKDIDLLIQAYNMAVEKINNSRESHAAKLLNRLPLERPMADSLAQVPTFKPASQTQESDIDNVLKWTQTRNIAGKRTDFSGLLRTLK